MGEVKINLGSKIEKKVDIIPTFVLGVLQVQKVISYHPLNTAISTRDYRFGTISNVEFSMINAQWKKGNPEPLNAYIIW